MLPEDDFNDSSDSSAHETVLLCRISYSWPQKVSAPEVSDLRTTKVQILKHFKDQTADTPSVLNRPML